MNSVQIIPSAEESELLKAAFLVIQNSCAAHLRSNPSFTQRMRATFDYGFAGGWVRKLQGEPQTIKLIGKFEFRKFIELIYMVALGIKEGASESAQVPDKLNVIKSIISEIATRGDVEPPPLDAINPDSAHHRRR
jgi:hypothetical protein